MRLRALLAAVALGAAACTSGGGQPSDRAARQGLVAQVASFDIAANLKARFLVGLLTSDNQFVTGGQVDMRFFYLGDPQKNEFYREATGEFLALPGEEPGHVHAHAHAGSAEEGRGVSAVGAISFDRPGPWEVRVSAEVDGETMTATAAFQVLEEPLVPVPGDRAPRTKNLTLRSDAPPAAVDSRGVGGEKIPDAQLHRTTIADAIKKGHPALVVFSTPVYCQSRFCGPITGMIADLQHKYGDRAEFIHVEIWREFQNQVINRAAADWLLGGGNLNEPWVFLIGADGVIEARWDNVATSGEIEPLLRDLPPLR